MPKQKKQPQPDGSLPKHVTDLLFEYAPGGYLIFYFNQETGQPEQAMSFDSPAHAMAIQKYMADWDEAIHQVNINNSIGNIIRTFGEDNDDNGKT